ncbi:MAG: DUF2975 domain-containing protein [Spirochaetota bacterium]|nr:DUF2975 domain-containing protein [Spirochaetota bacterium]
MKYLGKKSLSCFLSWFLHVVWFSVLAGFLFMMFFLCIVLFVEPVTDPSATGFNKVLYMVFQEVGSSNDQELYDFMKTHVALRLLAVSYLFVVLGLTLRIITKARLLFTNFKNNIVFSEDNVKILSKLSKLLIIFSIMTFSLTTFLLCVIILIMTGIFKSGASLQQENDLTI